jgi:regulator of RNase E activity RraA
MNDSELFAIIRERLFTAVIGDVMDKAGLRLQFLPPEIRPITPDTVVVGRAMPVAVADVDHREVEADPFGLMFRALDDLKPGEVYVAAGASPSYALWGGLMSNRAQRLGSAGGVFDGFHRDTREILRLGFPVFSHGAYAQDQRGRGRVADFRVPVTFSNGVRVAPGDIVCGDTDGVLVVPSGAATDIVQAALAKVEGERGVRAMIEAGETTEAIFTKTGIM